MCLEKECIAINRLSIKWYFDLSDEIKRYGYVSSTVWMHTRDAYKTHTENYRWELLKNAMSYFEQILEETPLKATAVWPSIFKTI